MKRVSVSLFFAVMWKGICQVLGWFFGLFGYKRDGKFAKCVWGLFATSGTIVMAFIALAILYAGWTYVRGSFYRARICNNGDCYHSTPVNGDIYFHDTEDGKGYIFNKRTGEKLVKHVMWIANPVGKDSLVCFSNGKKRGYFSQNTGRLVIDPQFDHAWVFSEGLASVDYGGSIKFIDTTGKTVIDLKTAYTPEMDGYVFHSGYCVVGGDNDEPCGLIDKTGRIVLPREYSAIFPEEEVGMWRVQKDEKMSVLDKDMKPVIPLMECKVWIYENMIDMTMPDHTMRKYDLQGRLINDFYITCVRTEEYETDEIRYRTEKTTDDDGETVYTNTESYHPLATARLRVYTAGDSYEGLMDADGHIVTMPLYKDIDAIGHDLYLCHVSNGDKVVVNGSGAVVR